MTTYFNLKSTTCNTSYFHHCELIFPPEDLLICHGMKTSEKKAASVMLKAFDEKEYFQLNLEERHIFSCRKLYQSELEKEEPPLNALTILYHLTLGYPLEKVPLPPHREECCRSLYQDRLNRLIGKIGEVQKLISDQYFLELSLIKPKKGPYSLIHQLDAFIEVQHKFPDWILANEMLLKTLKRHT